MPKDKKKKYGVYLYYHSGVYVEVIAESEEKAIDKARSKVTDRQVLESLIEESQPDVEEIKE